MPSDDPDFDRNVFINCPFDSEYVPLLRPLLFTVLSLGSNPPIASESFDSGETRISTICELINSSRFSIHDLSRIQARKKNEFFRLNMPFELGIDFGCRIFAEGKARSKKCLVLEKERYRYQKALSDMSGSDIKSHGNDPESLVREVRNWFIEAGSRPAPSGTTIWEHFNTFMADSYLARKAEGYRDKDLEIMPIPEYVTFIREWLQVNGIR